jgi:hypothetical protein
VDVLTLRHAKSREGAPTELEVLFFEPAPEDGIPEADWFTLLATAGLSARPLHGPCERAELVLRVQGRFGRAELRALGREFAEFAVMPHRLGIPLAPNLIVDGVALSLYPERDCLLVTEVSLRSPTWLPGVAPRVRLLRARPVYGSEADVIERIGDVEAARRFRRAGVNWDDPKRAPAPQALG